MSLPLSVRDFTAGAGKLRHREEMQVRQTLWLSASFPLCTYLMGIILVPSPIRTTHSAPRVLVWGTGSSRCHCHLEPAPSQPWVGDRASTGPPALPLHGTALGPCGQDLDSPAQPSIGGSISAAAQDQSSQGWHLPRQSPHTKGTRGKSHQLERQLQHREELSPDNQRRLFSYCAVS